MIAAHYQFLFILACVFGFFMAWGIGANDVANAMGTSVGSHALSFRQAVCVAAVFEALGTILAGGNVTDTIRGGIIDPSVFAANPDLYIYGMLASLLAAGSWLLLASARGWPVSTTHTIVGALLGFGCVCFGPDTIRWAEMGDIVGSWFITPIISGVIAFILFTSVQKFILTRDNPLRYAKRYIPYYIFLTGFIVAMTTLVCGIKHLGFHPSFIEDFIIATLIGLLIASLGKVLLRKLPVDLPQKGQPIMPEVEKGFAILMIFTASSMAFAHGSNDSANAIGPLVAVVQAISSKGVIRAHTGIPFWVLCLGASGIVIGLATYGYKVIRTIGKQIMELTPSRGFAAELATATTVILASATGLPISTTQTLVGAILGVGMARGIAAINLRVIRNIFLSWVITLPAGAGMAIIYYELLRIVLH